MTSSNAEPIYGAIEGGGTKFVLLAGSGPERVLRRASIPTTTPAETLAACIGFFQAVQAELPLAAIGVGMFGPVDLNPSSSTFGYVTATPKAGWAFTDIVDPLRAALGVPVGWENDVTAALLGERRWGAAAGLDPVVYVTVGTGIGAGAFVNGAPLRGLIHPEMGHLLLPLLPGDDFPGVCPYHQRCLEGLASGPAIARRTGRQGGDVPADDPVWSLVAEYLAMGFMSISLVLSPRRIVVGGGVAHQRHLLPMVRAALTRRLAGYLHHPLLLTDLDQYLVPAALGDDAGVLGALDIARTAATATQSLSS